MDLFEAIRDRRSIRSYKSDPVSDEVLNQIFEVVRLTPSWANTQCWEFVVIRDPEMKEKIQGTVPKFNPAYKAFGEAPIAVAALGRKNEAGFYKDAAMTPKGDWLMYDIGLAMHAFCLAAHSLGLGTVQVGIFDPAKVAEILGVPENVEVVALTPLGYVDKPSKMPKRKEAAEFVHYDKFGNKA
jgi:nitroreductase